MAVSPPHNTVVSVLSPLDPIQIEFLHSPFHQYPHHQQVSLPCLLPIW